ncbi:MAG: hypothetical protein SVU32_07465 [Candidatus Nanohaloarchaea archaeon]|nr:hypothetical protein [Candidatus Nanohaloarchaea archaeon]
MEPSEKRWHVDDKLVRDRLGEIVCTEGPSTPDDFGRVLRAYIESYISESLLQVDDGDWKMLGEEAYHSTVRPDEIIEAAIKTVERVQDEKKERFIEYQIDEKIEQYGHSIVSEIGSSVTPVTPDELRANLEQVA